MLLVIKICQL